MNKWIGIGRLSRDPEIRYTDGGMCIASFNVAVDRRFKKEGEQNADFINCVAFGKLAEHVEKFYRKGLKTGITGRLQTRNYTNRDGNKVYVTEVVVEEMEFAESKNSGEKAVCGTEKLNKKSNDPLDGFMNIPDGIDDMELPFN